MADHAGDTGEACGCYPFVAGAPDEGCAPCTPHKVLTCEEETILGTMRGIKGQVRSISGRLKEFHQDFGGTAGAVTGEAREDWDALHAQLAELREQWKVWEERLDAAIETKLILLGHREPGI